MEYMGISWEYHMVYMVYNYESNMVYMVYIIYDYEARFFGIYGTYLGKLYITPEACSPSV
jgi:hypothetical protein